MVHIVGAGAGDPELITVKGKGLLEKADVVIYAGSLVNPKLLDCCRAEAAIYNSASMTLEEVIAVIKQAAEEGKDIVRLHTGDPSIYGAIREQMDELRRNNIDFEIVPGVSSFAAVAAALELEYTLPGVTQTLIITRREGRTPMPESEKLPLLAAHGASMCIFLSANMIAETVADLSAGGYAADTPAAVVQKASWPGEEKILRGTLSDIAEKVKKAGIDRTAMIVVSRALGDDYELSRLYAADFSHGCRKASK